MQISEAESVVMEALWQESPRSADDIIDTVAPGQSWSAGTVKTLLNRLLKKGAISADRDGRRYLYRPLLARDDYVAARSEGLIDRLFGGELAPLVSHFSARRSLSQKDVTALKKLIEELDDDE